MTDVRSMSYVAGAIQPRDREALYNDNKSLYSREAALRRRFNSLGYFVGAAGALMGFCGVAAVLVMLPLEKTVPIFYLHDPQTGYIGEGVGARDAPATFSAQDAEHYMAIYLPARAGYAADHDRANYDTVAAMSSAQEWQKFLLERKAPDSPYRTIGASPGQVMISNITFDKPTSHENTWGYPVHYDKRVITDQSAENEVHHCNAIIDFQWHPELQMTQPARLINPAGMQVVSYQPIGCS